MCLLPLKCVASTSRFKALLGRPVRENDKARQGSRDVRSRVLHFLSEAARASSRLVGERLEARALRVETAGRSETPEG